MSRAGTSILGFLLLLAAGPGAAETQRWRVGDGLHPWNLSPVTGRLDWGRGWAVEILVDDDGDGRIDDDGVELIDNDGDALINEDGADPQVDNDGDGLVSEDPVNELDDDGDGFIDEDPEEAFDNDLDGLVDEDPFDPQVDDDGDGLLNEDGLMTNGDDDYDGLSNEDPPNGVDDDGDGLLDEDGPRLLDDPARRVTTWLRPIRLDSTRNLATLINERYLAGEFGGIVEGKDPLSPFMLVPSEFGFRNEPADPFSASNFSTSLDIARVDYGKMVDGDIRTAFGSTRYRYGGIAAYLMGFYHIDRVVFRPRPTLPNATIANYIIRYGTPETIDRRNEVLQASRTLVPEVRGQSNPVVKDLEFDPPVLMGRIDINSLDPKGFRVETAEVGLYGEGFPLDASFTSEIIDVGTPVPRFRRYRHQWELFGVTERDQVEAAFPDVPGELVNWGQVRWRGRRIGSGGDVRIQFRAGSSPDIHVYARRLGPGIEDTRDENGRPLDSFGWVKLSEGRIDVRGLQYNELGIDLGADDEAGWSFWSAPYRFEDGLIDESLPPEQWHTVGVPLFLPGRTRYIQFRIIFDSTPESAVMLDFLEFDYDVPLVSGGVLAEVFPAKVPLGEEVSFRYFLQPSFAEDDATSFNRLEIDVPDPGTRVDTLRFDGQDWVELPAPGIADADPLRDVGALRLTPPIGLSDSLGQFSQAVAVDPVTGSAKLLIKLPPMRAEDFRFGENFEVVFSARLFRGSTQFTSVIWDDRSSERSTVIPQPVEGGDASPEVATNALLVTVDEIGRLLHDPQATPNPFTPNGDGINDDVIITFDLFLLLEVVDVAVDIYDLSGRLVRRLTPVSRGAGSVAVSWDGRDTGGSLLPPGIYLYVLDVESNANATERVGTVTMVY